MKPYAELLEFNQPNPIRKTGFTRIRDAFDGLSEHLILVHKSPALGLSTESVNASYGGFKNPERIIEFAGRWDYGEKNARKLGETVTEKGGITPGQIPIIQKYLSMGHESMIEMGWATFFIECSRVVSHELVRHRLASYQQESQRFVKYDDAEFEDTFYTPDGMSDVETYSPSDLVVDTSVTAKEEFDSAYSYALTVYKNLRESGVAPQIARYVLPNAMRTRLVMTANIREWRHILRLRLDKSAQPEMQ